MNPLSKLARPFPLLLLCLFALALVRVGLAQLMPASYIYFDELVYLKLAQSLVDTHVPMLRGEYLNFPSLLYPLVLAPSQVIQLPHVGFKLAQLVNILLMSLAGIPLYLLAKRLIDGRFAWGVALLSLLAPYLVYTNVIMSENLFFPLVMAMAYCLVRSVDSGPGWKAWLGVTMGLAFFAKPHGMFLPLVILPAVLVAGPRSQVLRRVVSYWPTVLVFLAAALAHLIKTNYFLHSSNLLDPSTFFGTYTSGFGGRPLVFLAFARTFLADLCSVGMSLGGLPIVLFVPYAWTVLRKGTPDHRAFTVFTLALALLLIGITARHTVTLDDPNRIHERYCFYLAPLFLTGAAKAAQARLFKLVPAAIAGILFAIVCGAFLHQAMNSPFMGDTPSYAALWIPVMAWGQAQTILLAQGVGAIYALVLLLLLLKEQWRSSFALGAVYALVMTGCALKSQYLHSTDYARRFQLADWVEAHRMPGLPTAVIADRFQMVDVWTCESVSRRPISVYYLGAPVDNWNDRPITTGPDGELTELGALPDGALIVAHKTKQLDLPVVSRRDDTVLYRKRGKVKLALPGSLSGVGPDHWSSGRFEYRTSRGLAQEAFFDLTLDTHGLPQRIATCSVVIEDATGRRQLFAVARDRLETLTARVRSNGRSGFHVNVTTPSWIPAKEGVSQDKRTLGVMVQGADLYAK